MAKIRIGLLNKRRGNFSIQAKLGGADSVVDTTDDEVAHHEQALIEAGYDVSQIRWGPHFVRDLQEAQVDLVFNVSSLAEAAILEELEIPFVGSDAIGCAIATDKSLAKILWQRMGLPTSPFLVARSEKDCQVFDEQPPFDYPLFIKPVAGRGSAGINKASVVRDYDQLVQGVRERLTKIGQPVLIERFLQGREISVGVVGNGEHARVLPPLEIVYREGDLTLTFEKKELDNDSFLCPAPLNERRLDALQLLVLQAYRALGLKDYARFDTIWTDRGPTFLEANRPRVDADVIGGSSDHLILGLHGLDLAVGTQVQFDVQYSALLRAMTSPYVKKAYYGRSVPDVRWRTQTSRRQGWERREREYALSDASRDQPARFVR